MPTAEIITIGTELLLGETADTNTRFIAKILRGLGVDLYRTQTVGDNAGRIARAVSEAQQHADIVITTGGLGPTVDDPTRQAIAEAIGVALEFHPELWEQIVARIGRYGRMPTENQKRQAYIPKGAIVIENPVGTAPAFIVETRDGAVITLPGVPREMETLLTESVVPYLQKRFDLHDIIKIRTLHISGLGEGVLDCQVGDLETLNNPTVGLTAHSGIVDIRIAAKASTPAEAEDMIAKVEQDIRDRLGKNIFGTDSDTLEGITLDALAQRGWTLACFERGLDGALQRRLERVEHPAYRGGRADTSREETLAQATEAVRQEFNATASIGMALSISSEKQGIDVVTITPLGHKERYLPYGGHPKNAARWAINTALDRLLRFAQGLG
ncbi:MAG: molybdopterin-binding protein [Anaerolineales bacterium]|jgi:competence/damage-inducible protein CinA-like protein